MKRSGIEKGVANSQFKISGLQIRRNWVLCLSCVFFAALCSCNPQKALERKSNRIIEETYVKADTVFQFSNYSNQTEVIWYHDDSLMYVYIIRPFNVKKLQPIFAINSNPTPESIEKSFSNTFDKEDTCFQNMLDGTAITMHIKNQQKKWSSLDVYCLLSKDYMPNTIAYKMKYDLSLIINRL